MKHARIVNDTAVDVRTESPEGCFTPDIAAQFVEVPDEVENGWSLKDGVWSAPPAPEPVPEPTPAPRTWTAADVRKGLTLAEKVKWDNNTAPEIVTVKTEFAVPQGLTATTDLLQFLVDSALISQSSASKVLA